MIGQATFVNMKDKIKLSECISAVEKFHNSFGIANEYSPTAKISENEYFLRYNLMKEENEEYLTAAKEGDRVEIFGEHNNIYSICNKIESIPYEFLSKINRRIKRVYINQKISKQNHKDLVEPSI